MATKRRDTVNGGHASFSKRKALDILDASHSVREELLAKAKKWEVDWTSLDFAKKMDEMDHLAHLRNEFHYPKCGGLPKVNFSLVDKDEDSVYFCGNSLGLLPKKTSVYIQRELDKWAQMGVHGHFLGELPWALCDEKLTEESARLVGAKETEVAQMNGLTINQHLLLIQHVRNAVPPESLVEIKITESATKTEFVNALLSEGFASEFRRIISFYQPTPKRKKILLESKAFPSDHYAIESQIKLRGYDPKECMICMEPREGEVTLRNEDILRLIEEQGDEIATIMFPGVQYYTGQLFDMKSITKAGHKKGCYVGFDLAHAVGNVEIALHDWDVDFACWCTYKYVNSGAGGMAGAFIHERLKKKDLPKLCGWWSHKMESRFLMDNQLDASEGIAGYRISNPPMLLAASLQASLEIFSKTSMAELCAKSRLLTGYLESLLKHYFPKPEVEDSTRSYVTILTPSEPEWRGCQLSVMFSLPIKNVFQALEERGVVCDKREPSVLRLAPTPLYNSFRDVHKFIQILGEALSVLSRK